ncbi:uncharacterized protein LOC126320470 [Schistocerca gregaria]|uniref:uncharacterized protein LOC126320470 n=1 Tax=Schistocerca gregaria TaxID=7010 RepID=UPI00211E9A09|nr:uncharacterized protein LOC126320470 [Schistocerca gregaria]
MSAFPEGDSAAEGEGPVTETVRVQSKAEDAIYRLLKFHEIAVAVYGDSQICHLNREAHARYLLSALEDTRMPQSFYCNRMWVLYWVLHSLELLDVQPPLELRGKIISWLAECQSTSGGFGGGPGQLSHLAPSYAAILAIVILGPDAYSIVNRPALYRWLMSLKQADGCFLMHDRGESDVRAPYCALTLANLTNTMTEELISGIDEFVVSCQSYEGGIGACPGGEAHGGYTFCGLASLVILEKAHLLDLDGLLHWAAMKQMSIEGGFQGRTNKLVDGCYSWWLAALFAMLDRVYINKDRYCEKGETRPKEPTGKNEENQNYEDEKMASSCHGETDARAELCDNTNNADCVEICDGPASASRSTPADSKYHPFESACRGDEGSWLFDQMRLQQYIIVCCQDSALGGLKDRPDTNPDYYHTCYGLSGLSIAQHNAPYSPFRETLFYNSARSRVQEMNWIYNVGRDKVKKIKEHFKKLVKPLYEKSCQ